MMNKGKGGGEFFFYGEGCVCCGLGVCEGVVQQWECSVVGGVILQVQEGEVVCCGFQESWLWFGVEVVVDWCGRGCGVGVWIWIWLVEGEECVSCGGDVEIGGGYGCG